MSKSLVPDSLSAAELKSDALKSETAAMPPTALSQDSPKSNFDASRLRPYIQNRNPAGVASNWEIKASVDKNGKHDGRGITATCSQTGDSFEGTQKEFSALIKTF